MSSLVWDKDTAKSSKTAETDPKEMTSTPVAAIATTGINDNVSDISDANSIASDANGKVNEQGQMHTNAKKRKKGRRANKAVSVVTP